MSEHNESTVPQSRNIATPHIGERYTHNIIKPSLIVNRLAQWLIFLSVYQAIHPSAR